MKDYAIVYNDMIVNVIVAESKETAEQVTKFPVIECVDGKPGIGWIKINDEWKSYLDLTPPLS